MRTRLPRGRVRRVVVGLTCVAAVLLMGAWTGVHAWYPAHLEAVTGRADAPAVSCLHCHRPVEAPPTRGAATASGYVSPADLIVAPDGTTLYVAASGMDRVLAVDLEGGEVIRTVEVAGRPHGLALTDDGERLAVTSRDRDLVTILDTATWRTLETIDVGAEPLGVALSGDGSRVFVACGAGDGIWIAATGSSSPPLRLAGGNEPYAVSLDGDGRLLAVANRLVRPAPPRTLTASEVTLVDAGAGRVLERRRLASAHLSEGVALSSDGSFALATVIRFRNLLPITQVSRGAVMNSAVAFVETGAGGRTVQLPLDEVNAYFADPSDVVLTPDDRRAFVAHGGARTVTALDVEALRAVVESADAGTLQRLPDDLGWSSRYVLARIPTLDNPRSLAMAPDGRRLYVAEHLADSVAVIDTERLEVVGRIDLGGPRVLTPERRGERVFSDASVTFQGQFSCRSCHPDGHTDGLVWDFDIDGIGENLVETRSLRGIRDTAPFKWNGKNPDLPTQCGPRFARVLTRSDPFSPDDLRDLVSFIESIPIPAEARPPSDGLAESRRRGRRLFFRTETTSGEAIPPVQRCSTCHRPPLFTDRLPVDVGTGGEFDTPHLFDVAGSAPYLHDGRARSLEEIWTVFNPDDAHGLTSDLTKAQLNDLVNYLKGL